MKTAITSKTIWLNLVPLLIALSDVVVSYLNHSEKSQTSVVVLVLTSINIILRFMTNQPLSRKLLLFLPLLLASCSSVQQKLEPELFYKRDVGIEVNGEYFEGVTTVPYSKIYDITLVPPGDIDLMLIRTCHREYAVEKASRGWGIFGKKKKFTYQYIPVAGIEDVRICPLRIEVYESEKGRHSWALVEMENPKYKIRYHMDCNGVQSVVNGTGVCQAREHSVQRVTFNEPVRFAPPSAACQAPKKVNGSYEIAVVAGECPYVFDTESGAMGRLTVVGWQGVLIREAQ